MQNTTNKTGNKIHGTINSYLELMIAFCPRKINSDEELNQIQEVIDSFLDKPNLTKDEKDYLHLLGLLVSEYEEQNYPIPDIYGAELLKVLIQESNLETKDLLSIFNTEKKLNDILEEKQQITLEEVEKLAKFFQVSPAVFLPNLINYNLNYN